MAEYYEFTVRIPKPNRNWLRYSLRSGLIGLVIVCIVLGYYANQWQLRRKEASVGGKYTNLQRTVYAPNDRSYAGVFNDWGYWSGTSYLGETQLPPGYWVYVEPNWYIWKDKSGTVELVIKQSP